MHGQMVEKLQGNEDSVDMPFGTCIPNPPAPLKHVLARNMLLNVPCINDWRFVETNW